MDKLRRVVCLLILAFAGITVHAQTVNPEPQDMMHSNGKIYVVVAVVVTILLGLFLYVFSLDRKISKLEKREL